jgi:hypothetical protein
MKSGLFPQKVSDPGRGITLVSAAAASFSGQIKIGEFQMAMAVYQWRGENQILVVA